MKHLYLFIASLTLVSYISYGQEVSYGLKIGANLSSLSGTVNENPNWKSGIMLSGCIQLPLSNQIYYNPEIAYSQQGSIFVHAYKSQYNSEKEETKVRLNYINILPLSAKAYLSKTKDFYLFLGPQVGILLTASEDGVKDGQTVDKEISSNFKSVDFAISGGLGADFKSGVNIGMRLNYGLTDISNQSKDYTTGFTRPNLTNVVFQFHLGYTL